MADLATLRRHFTAAQSAVHRLERSLRTATTSGTRAFVEGQLRQARANLTWRRRELEAAEAKELAHG